jgi:hypothetical protein
MLDLTIIDARRREEFTSAKEREMIGSACRMSRRGARVQGGATDGQLAVIVLRKVNGCAVDGVVLSASK